MIEWRIEDVNKTPSTMNLIHDRAHQAAEEGLVIRADEQLAARGRGNNIWISNKGNLYTSILLRPQIPQKDAGQYSFITAVSLHRTLKSLIDGQHRIQNKWPNDVLVNGKKIAGILLESDINPDGTISYLNIGLGVNITNAPEERISLHEVANRVITAESLLKDVLNNLNDVITIYTTKGFAAVRDEWLQHAMGVGQKIKIRLPHELFEATFITINDNGALLVKLDSGDKRLIHSGDVFFE